MVSFILPAYKREFLYQSIQSILNQSYENFELVIVNDCSPDNLEEIVRAFNDSRIRYYENRENEGGTDLIAHWNHCLQKAKGDYVVLASDDDFYERHYLFYMMELVNKYPNVDLFHCRFRYVDNDNNMIQISQPALEYETCIDFVYQRLIWQRKQALQEFLFRRTALENIGGLVNFPIAWYSDDATWNALSRNGVAYDDKILFNFRMSNLNISNKTNRANEKIAAMKKYVLWLNDFLPSIQVESGDELYMKNRLLNEFRRIIYGHYMLYLPYLSLADFNKEMHFARQNNIFSAKQRFMMRLKRFL